MRERWPKSHRSFSFGMNIFIFSQRVAASTRRLAATSYNGPTMRQDVYDIVVIGGGHAGAEAAWTAANLGAQVALVTMDTSKTGAMSCNPAIGGLAKGQIVRELDALGGLMPLAADATGIQFRVLNVSKGPAVRGPRCQSDKYAYAREVQRLLACRENIDTIEGTVEQILVEEGRVTGVCVQHQGESLSLNARAVILTTGTFMRGLMHTGESKTAGGRVGEDAAVTISDTLRELGFDLGRLKTGTPPRLDANTIDFDSLEIQPGDEQPQPFSDITGRADWPGGDALAASSIYSKVATQFPVIEQRHCWITYTNEDVHQRIRDNLDRAPMYNGQIETAGPRYCPSIEDKVVRFADRTSHHVFLEPESLETDEIYCNGISTSLPADVQDFVVASLPGCANAKILKYGYAVEYDMVWPHQIDATCMTKLVSGLFLAGQINGTSGYEEAAGQGLVAGLNAVHFVRGQEQIRFGRDEAYIGVMMDDLVTKTPREPYRMFTSRAEHRLLLRADNADDRLTPMGRDLGLVDDVRWHMYRRRVAALQTVSGWMDRNQQDGQSLSQWVRRPEIDVPWLLDRLNGAELPPESRDRRLLEQLLADATYSGYIERHRRQHARLSQQDAQPLPESLDYLTVEGLRNEARHTLNKFRPATLGQAGRLAGITPADLMVLSVAIGR